MSKTSLSSKEPILVIKMCRDTVRITRSQADFKPCKGNQNNSKTLFTHVNRIKNKEVDYGKIKDNLDRTLELNCFALDFSEDEEEGECIGKGTMSNGNECLEMETATREAELRLKEHNVLGSLEWDNLHL